MRTAITLTFRLLWFAAIAAMLFFAIAPGEDGGVGGASWHIVAFAGLGVLTPLAFPRIHLALIWLFLLALAAGIEGAQAYTRLGRTADMDDFIVGAVAATAGILAYRIAVLVWVLVGSAGPTGEAEAGGE